MISFFVYRASNYAVASITNELLEATAGDGGAFMKEGTLVMDTAIKNITNDLAGSLFGDGSGSRGQISAISSGVITLVDPVTVTQFEVGMVLVSYSVSGLTPTQSTSAALGYVIAVNRRAGTVTVSATSGGSAGTPTNWSTSFKYLAVQGDIAFASNSLAISSSGALKLCGFGAWIPSTAPTTGDSFWGVDRSVDSRLYGQYIDASAESIEEGLIDAVAQICQEGGAPDYGFINFTSYAALLKALGSKVQYVEVKHEEADISFAGIRLHSAYGPITIIPDRSVGAKTCWLLQLDTWKLRSVNKMPHILTYGMEGLEALRVGTADAVEIRWGFYGAEKIAA